VTNWHKTLSFLIPLEWIFIFLEELLNSYEYREYLTALLTSADVSVKIYQVCEIKNFRKFFGLSSQIVNSYFRIVMYGTANVIQKAVPRQHLSSFIPVCLRKVLSFFEQAMWYAWRKRKMLTKSGWKTQMEEKSWRT
jgi:hypothetical protein